MDDAVLLLVDGLIRELPEPDVLAGEERARRELARLPVPLRPDCDPAARRRRELQRIVACLAARSGRTRELVGVLMRDFNAGASARPLVELLILLAEPAFAATVARLALAAPNCSDREEIERLLASTGKAPDGWSEALLEFARSPSVEAWDDLQRFTPDDVYYDRVRNALRVLRGFGVDPALLFQISTRHGTTPDAIELIETGQVPPELVEARGKGSPAAATWLALAAVAAHARGEYSAVAHYLRAARRAPGPTALVEALTQRIHDDPDPELRQHLDAKRVPRLL